MLPAELARMYRNEGNEYFREKEYQKAVIAYTEGLKKKCEDPEMNAVLHTNRGAAQFYLGKGHMLCCLRPACFPMTLRTANPIRAWSLQSWLLPVLVALISPLVLVTSRSGIASLLVGLMLNTFTG